jgi:CMP/dCMP kinase
MIITIDGPIATGKSTIAKAVAKELGYIYFDTGAMYRCLTYGIIKNKINFQDPVELKKYLDPFRFDIKVKMGEKHYFVENEDVTDKIRQEQVTSLVSQTSAIKEVREKLVSLQKAFSQGVNAVFEGRDMGSVVFPEAQVKIFLAGNADVRAKRRFNELRTKFPAETENLTFEQVLADVNQRDHYDMTREISPLCQPKDACVIDTSNLSVSDIVLKILEYKDTIKTHNS